MCPKRGYAKERHPKSSPAEPPSSEKPRARRDRAGQRRAAPTIAFHDGTTPGPVSGVVERSHTAPPPDESPALPAVIVSARLLADVADDLPLVPPPPLPAPPDFAPPPNTLTQPPRSRPLSKPSRAASRGWIPALGLSALALSVLLIPNSPSTSRDGYTHAEIESPPKPLAALTPTTPLAPSPEPVAELTPKPEPVAELTPKPEPVAELTPKPEPVAELTPKTEPIATRAPSTHKAARALHVPRPTPPSAEPDDLATRYDAVPPKAATVTAEHPDAHQRHDEVPPKAATATAALREREANHTSPPLSGTPRLYLQTHPAGAEIWLLGQLRGKSPMSLDLDGPIEVTLTHPEHQPTRVTLAPVNGTRWISVPLAPR